MEPDLSGDIDLAQDHPAVGALHPACFILATNTEQIPRALL
jgi:hypothetical protein